MDLAEDKHTFLNNMHSFNTEIPKGREIDVNFKVDYFLVETQKII